MPIRRAAVWFCATARMARPKRVARKSATSASIRTSEAPMTPSDTGATRTGPIAMGRFENRAGNGSSSLVHTMPAAARSASDSPSVMISTSQWVAETARRMIARSTRNARTPPALAETRRWAAPGSKSAALFAQAQGVMPGGNTRTTVYMAPYPPYAASGDGCWITDVEGDRRLDCLNNYTALIHGHAHPAIVDAATRRLALGASFPLPTPEEVELATLLCERLPSAERVRFTNSGSEAVMMAIKGARAWTGRPKIAKFEGAYHGSYDYAEVSLSSAPEQWGSLAAPASTAYSRGVPPAVLDAVVVLPFNHAELAVARIEREAKCLAPGLVDPIPNPAGLIPAQRDFLRALRR